MVSSQKAAGSYGFWQKSLKTLLFFNHSLCSAAGWRNLVAAKFDIVCIYIIAFPVTQWFFTLIGHRCFCNKKIVIIGFMQLWHRNSSLFTHLFNGIGYGSRLCVTLDNRFKGLSLNQLEKLEAVKASWLVRLILLSLTGSLLVLLGKFLLALPGPTWPYLAPTGPN